MKKKVTCRGGGWEGGRYLSKIENGVSACLSDGKIEDLHMLCLLCFTKERTNGKAQDGCHGKGKRVATSQG